MRRQSTFENCSDSFLRHLNNDEEGQISSNNCINSGQSQTSDLKNLSSSIICSANITRKSLLQERNIMSTSNYDYNTVDDDDEEFFKKIKIDIDKNLLQNSKENYKPNNIIQQDIFALRKRKPIIDEDTQNIIKRFKKDANIDRTNFMQTPTNNISTTQSNFNNTIRQYPYEAPRNINSIKNIMKQQNTKRCPMYSVPTSINDVGNLVKQKNTINCPMYNLPSTNDNVGNIIRQKDTYNLPGSPTVRQENTIRCPKYNLLTNANAVGNIMKQQTIFTSNDLHIRNPNKYVFKMCSKTRKDKIGTAVVRTECKEVSYYATMYLTPPRGNFSEDD